MPVKEGLDVGWWVRGLVRINYNNITEISRKELINRFIDYQTIDRGVCVATAKQHVWRIQKLLKEIDKPINTITLEDIRCCLKKIRGEYDVGTYSNFIKSLRVFFGKFLGLKELANGFAFPSIGFTPKLLSFSKDDLKRFYYAIDHEVVRLMFLLYAVTGLRRMELMNLKVDDLQLENRTIVPHSHAGRTKHTYCTFFNEEAKLLLEDYLTKRDHYIKYRRDKLFPISEKRTFNKYWNIARERTKLNLKVKDLRDWFANELEEEGVPDRVIDYLQGRVPKSILNRRYKGYSIKKLKEYYDKAGLTVLS